MDKKDIETMKIGLFLFAVIILGAYYFIVDKYLENKEYDALFQKCIKEQMHLTYTRKDAGIICKEKLSE